MLIKNKIRTILRRASFGSSPKYNILVIGSTHERYEEQLCKTGHNFYVMSNGKEWNNSYAKRPSNYIKLDYWPSHLHPDVVLTHLSGERLAIGRDYADFFGVNLIRHTHTLPESERELSIFRSQHADFNTYISDFSMKEWGIPGRVIEHGLDTDFWKYTPSKPDPKTKVLSVVNLWADRDWACGWNLYNSIKRICKVDYQVFGSNPGLSSPARNTKQLVDAYSNAAMFLNTSQFSPVPMALLEAMSCDCPVISSPTCMIPDIITHGKNGLLASTPEEFKQNIELLLSDPELARKIGVEGGNTIRERFNLTNFINSWNKTFNEAIIH